MQNLWYVYGLMLLARVGLIITIIYVTLTKEKYYIVIDIILAIFIVITLISNVPHIKDLTQKETIEIVGIYTSYNGNSTINPQFNVYFETTNGKEKVIIPKLAFIFPKLEEGKTYKIEYFKNTRIIKEYKLIE